MLEAPSGWYFTPMSVLEWIVFKKSTGAATEHPIRTAPPVKSAKKSISLIPCLTYQTPPACGLAAHPVRGGLDTAWAVEKLRA